MDSPDSFRSVGELVEDLVVNCLIHVENIEDVANKEIPPLLEINYQIPNNYPENENHVPANDPQRIHENILLDNCPLLEPVPEEIIIAPREDIPLNKFLYQKMTMSTKL